MVTKYNKSRVPKKRGRSIVIPDFEPTDKFCPNCRKWHNIKSGFYSNAARKDGAGTHCKKCENAMRSDRRKRAREKNLSGVSV